jgi:hypothetical protein
MQNFKYGPKPVPTLTGEAAKQFLEQDAKPLTEKEEALLVEGKCVYETINFNSQQKQKRKTKSYYGGAYWLLLNGRPKKTIS